MARVLVTGGAGFVGSHVVDGLLEKGHEMLVVDDLSTGTRSNVSTDVEFVDLDIADDSFVSLARSFKPDIISHLAAQASVPVSMKRPKPGCPREYTGRIECPPRRDRGRLRAGALHQYRWSAVRRAGVPAV